MSSTKVDYEALKREVEQAVNILPQRSVIADRVAQDWVDGIIKQDPERALWHVDRARGIGGSEIGELLLNHLGMDSYLNDPASISREKLLLKLPERNNQYMRRGTQLEQLARRVFELTTNGRTRMDDERLHSLVSGPSPKHEFAVGNPDDVFVLDDGAINPVDYKVRSTLDWSAPTPLTYIAQVHWYTQIMQDHSGDQLKVGPLSVAQLDIPNALSDSLLEDGLEPERVEAVAQAIAQSNVRGFGMCARSVDWNQRLMDDCLQAAKSMWYEQVMNGKPFYHPTVLSKPDSETLDRAQRLSQELAVAKVAEKGASELVDQLQGELKEIAATHDVSAVNRTDTPITVSQTQKLDAEAAANELMARGVPRESLQKSTGHRLNPEKAQQLIERLGGDPSQAMDRPWDTQTVRAHLKQDEALNAEQFSSPGFSAGLGRSNEKKPVVEQAKKEMIEHITAWNKHGQQENQHPESDIDDDEDLEQSGLSLA